MSGTFNSPRRSSLEFLRFAAGHSMTDIGRLIRFCRRYISQLPARTVSVGILLGIALGLGAELGSPAFAGRMLEGPSAETECDGVVFRLMLDKNEYEFAEPVNIQYIVTNGRPTTFYLQFSSSVQFYFHVYGADGAVYAPALVHFWWLTQLRVEPGETYVYSTTWSQISCVGSCRHPESVWPGHYTLSAYLYGYEAMTGLAVEFGVTGAPQNRISGTLPYDTVLTKGGSPYCVPDDLIVPAEMTLTIEPGVELQLDYAQGPQDHSWSDRGAGLLVYGTLIARGTPEEKIVFRSVRSSPTSADWKGISFLTTAKDARFHPETGRYVDGCILEHCIIEHAVTPLGMDRASPLVSNCIIRNSGEPKEPPELEVPAAGIIDGSDSRALFVNCTILRNFKYIYGDFTFVNSIIWHNEDLELQGFSAQHCNIEGGYSGPGNINADPLFVDLVGGDYHLRPDSPCVDAGTSDVEGIPEQDMDGEARVLGAEIDMGADECLDSDGDLLPDYLERFHFESLSWGPDDDPDCDGMSIAEELVCGTNPSNPHSCLKVTEIMPLELSTRVWWNALPGRQYRVDASENMKDWLCISPVITREDLPGEEPTLFIDKHDRSFRQRFYRIEALP